MGIIEELAKQGEGQTLEFKQSMPKDFAKTICGMANASGGTILLGVRDDGSIEGFGSDNKTIADIENRGASCEPTVRLSVRKLGECLAIKVEESHEKPVLCKQGYFIRNTHYLTKEEYREECPDTKAKLGSWWDSAFERGREAFDNLGDKVGDFTDNLSPSTPEN